MSQDKRKIIFISSKQDELAQERKSLRDLINQENTLLAAMYIAKSFEDDLSGRKESVDKITEEWVLKSDVYLGIFDRKYSEATKREYEIALNDKIVRKEIMIFICKRNDGERDAELNEFLSVIKNPTSGHSCKIYDNLQDLLLKANEALFQYQGRSIEGFIISEEVLGKNLDGARHTNFPEKLRRQLLQPFGVFMIRRGRRGIYELYRYDENGVKIDVTWEMLQYEKHVSEEKKEFYRKRYLKPFD